MSINKEIFEKYLKGTCTASEKHLVEDWFEELDVNNGKLHSSDLIDKHIVSLDKRLKLNNKSKSFIYKRFIQIAAAVSIFIGIAYYLYTLTDDVTKAENQIAIEDIKAPVLSNAIIVLDDGNEFSLDELAIGNSINANGYTISKLPSGELHYTFIDDTKSKSWNTIRTKFGGVANVKLSDGSIVWLNSNSELTYPVSFEKSSRIVRLKGEGYFEVTSAESVGGKPFYVCGDYSTIKVLGTKFNADFYNKNTAIALVEGSVGINSTKLEDHDLALTDFSVKLAPNQYYAASKIQNSGDITRFIDWKLGYFDLNEINLESFGEKIKRWYNIDIQIDNRIKHKKLFGRLDRNKNLDEVLEVIAVATPIHYYIRDNVLYINPK